jgi:hypothetical protein
MSRPRHLAAAWSLSLAAALAAGGAAYGDADRAAAQAVSARASAPAHAGPQPLNRSGVPLPLRPPVHAAAAGRS